MAQQVVDISGKLPNKHHTVVNLSEDGLGVNINANGNYSSVNKTFSYSPDADKTFFATRIIFYIEDSGTFDSEDYGNGITLTNGYHIWHTDGDSGIDHVLIPPTDPIRTTGDIAALMYDISHNNFGAGNEFLAARFTFEKLGGPVILRGEHGDSFNMEFRDNQAGLVRHEFKLQGITVANRFL